MLLEEITTVLGWCTALNYSLLLLWFLLFVTARGWLYGIHSRWFTISDAHFDAIHYAGMALYKIAWVLFNLVPYVALRIVL